MFSSGSHPGLTKTQSTTLREAMQDRADVEGATIIFSESGTEPDITLSWTVITAPLVDKGAGMAATAAGATAPETAFRFLVNSGWKREHAAGLLGNIEAESNFDHMAVGDKGAAFGVCQWHGDRQSQFRNHFGHSMQESPSLAEQLAFVDFELRLGNETKAGKALLNTTSPDEAGRVVSTFYERPDDPNGAAAEKRARLAMKWFNNFKSLTV